jgi:PKHD-type hydroxylase
MLRVIPELLSSSEVREILDGLETGEFVDGKASAGKKARQVKENLQLRHGTQESDKLSEIVIKGIERSSELAKITLAHRVAPVLFSRYEPGMEYGFHMDSPIRTSKAGPFRTDISMTLFLSDPGSYEGGELVIETELGEQPVKLDAGDAVIYPSISLHRVNRIDSGTRLAAVTWIQSLIGDPAQRQILTELQTVREWMLENHPNSAEDNTLTKIHGILMRLWASG